jgi:hypothetical protein
VRLLAALVVVLLAAGCGSSSSGLSHAELVSKADAICARSQAASQKLHPKKTVAGVKQAIDAGVALATKELADLRALKAGKDDQAGFAAVTDAFAVSIAAAKRASAALGSGNQLRAQLYLQAALRQTSQAAATAGGFGLKVCSKIAA